MAIHRDYVDVASRQAKAFVELLKARATHIKMEQRE